MDTKYKRILLFLIFCIGTRSLLTYSVFVHNKKYKDVLRNILLIPAIGFAFIHANDNWHKYSHLLFRFADNEEVGLPFEYDTSENSINVFSRQEIIENIIEVQKWLKDRGMVY